MTSSSRFTRDFQMWVVYQPLRYIQSSKKNVILNTIKTGSHHKNWCSHHSMYRIQAYLHFRNWFYDLYGYVNISYDIFNSLPNAKSAICETKWIVVKLNFGIRKNLKVHFFWGFHWKKQAQQERKILLLIQVALPNCLTKLPTEYESLTNSFSALALTLSLKNIVHLH